MANTLIKNVLCQEDTLDPDGFNRNQVKVLPCSLIAIQQRPRIKIVSWAKSNLLEVWFVLHVKTSLAKKGPYDLLIRWFHKSCFHESRFFFIKFTAFFESK